MSRTSRSATDNIQMTAENQAVFLGNMLFREYNQKVFFLVDEYDVPLQKATVNKYYDDMLNVIRGMLGSALKTNSCMKKGFVTGCLRISHQSIFTGINHFATFGLDDMRYSRFIGLTKDETEQLLKNCGMEKRLDDVRTWYDGYNIAGNDMLCPWSVLNFLSNALAPDNDPSVFMPENYWINSSGNDIVDLCMKYPSSEHSEKLQKLINGETEEIHCREFTTYPDIFNAGKTATASFDTFATLMLHTGYLTCVKNAKATNGNTVIKIPNEEIRNCFKAKAEYIFSSDNPEWREKGCCLRDALFEGKPEEIQKIIDSMLMTFISFRDSLYESYYHGFMTGVLSMVKTAEMELKSNHESGNGFSDVIIQNENSKSAVILEFKRCENGDPATRDNVCCAALSQIDAKQYDYDLKQRGYTRIFKYGVAFYGKGCTVGMNGSENR